MSVWCKSCARIIKTKVPGSSRPSQAPGEAKSRELVSRSRRPLSFKSLKPIEALVREGVFSSKIAAGEPGLFWLRLPPSQTRSLNWVLRDFQEVSPLGPEAIAAGLLTPTAKPRLRGCAAQPPGLSWGVRRLWPLAVRGVQLAAEGVARDLHLPKNPKYTLNVKTD